ncbi:hypothetical protein JTB14_019514 [Gonioctena quinquepunctata]|nr:hypothetical protein JTB14_019514 [Gonioctena quinquepunctata]
MLLEPFGVIEMVILPSEVKDGMVVLQTMFRISVQYQHHILLSSVHQKQLIEQFIPKFVFNKVMSYTLNLYF